MLFSDAFDVVQGRVFDAINGALQMCVKTSVTRVFGIRLQHTGLNETCLYLLRSM